MKKIIEKVIKRTKKAINEPIPATIRCPVCLGSGLWRPDYTNSPQCEKCKGHGVITI